MKPNKCPICNGTGLVPGGFYTSALGGTGTSSAATEQCRQCKGTGIIWSDDVPNCGCGICLAHNNMKCPKMKEVNAT